MSTLLVTSTNFSCDEDVEKMLVWCRHYSTKTSWPKTFFDNGSDPYYINNFIQRSGTIIKNNSHSTVNENLRKLVLWYKDLLAIYNKVVYIDSNILLQSKNAFDLINNTNEGMVAFWKPESHPYRIHLLCRNTLLFNHFVSIQDQLPCTSTLPFTKFDTSFTEHDFTTVTSRYTSPKFLKA